MNGLMTRDEQIAHNEGLAQRRKQRDQDAALLLKHFAQLPDAYSPEKEAFQRLFLKGEA